MLTGIVSCVPIASQWNPNIPFKCVNQIVLFTVALATDVVSDGEIWDRMFLLVY